MADTQIRIDYDDQLNEVVDKVNAALAAHELEFRDDGEAHDGYCLYNLVSTDFWKRNEPSEDRPFDHCECDREQSCTCGKRCECHPTSLCECGRRVRQGCAPNW